MPVLTVFYSNGRAPWC